MRSEAEATTLCQNCGADAPAKFCPECGQSTTVALPTLWGFLQEAVGAFFSYDHKLWATLRMLITRPGQLTVDYVEGRRVRYLAPFQLLFWLQALTFLAYKLTFDAAEGGADRQSKAVLTIGTFLAVALALLHFRKGASVLLHFLTALHLWAFLMVLLLIEYITVPLVAVALQKLKLVQGALPIGDFVTHSVEISLSLYLVLAIRRIYKDSLPVAILKTLVLLVAYLGFVQLIRL
jgi:hypothetical protein